MEALIGGPEPPDVSIDQRASTELVKLVRKLRWMGMDKEAEVLENALHRFTPADSVLAAPRETD